MRPLAVLIRSTSVRLLTCLLLTWLTASLRSLPQPVFPALAVVAFRLKKNMIRGRPPNGPLSALRLFPPHPSWTKLFAVFSCRWPTGRLSQLPLRHLAPAGGTSLLEFRLLARPPLAPPWPPRVVGLSLPPPPFVVRALVGLPLHPFLSVGPSHLLLLLVGLPHRLRRPLWPTLFSTGVPLRLYHPLLCPPLRSIPFLVGRLRHPARRVLYPARRVPLLKVIPHMRVS
jgi:hypothetical protein